MSKEKTTNDALFSWGRLRSDEELSDFISRKLEKFEVLSQELNLETL
jgi:hypothetical protein